MARTHKKVRFLPKGKPKHTVASAAKGVEEVLRILEGRWKLVILFHLFGGNVRRFSELRRAIPAVSEKMLDSAASPDGTRWHRAALRSSPGPAQGGLQPHGLGQALCPGLDALLTWVDLKETLIEAPPDLALAPAHA